MKYFLAVFILSTGCWGFGAVPLPSYTGSREPQEIAQVLIKRFGWKSFLGTGQGRVYDAPNDLKQSFDFEIRLDRRPRGLRGLAFNFSKSLTGTLYEITSHPKRHLFVDYTADPPGWLELDLRDQFQALGGTSLKMLRQALIYSWPPRAKIETLEDEVVWGNWRFDRETLALKYYETEDFRWIFSQWQPHEESYWRAEKWRFQTKESWMEFVFDADSEEDFAFTQWDFEFDTGTLGPLKKVGH